MQIENVREFWRSNVSSEGALVLDLRTSVGFGPLALKGKDIAADKTVVERLQPAKNVLHMGFHEA